MRHVRRGSSGNALDSGDLFRLPVAACEHLDRVQGRRGKIVARLAPISLPAATRLPGTFSSTCFPPRGAAPSWAARKDHAGVARPGEAAATRPPEGAADATPLTARVPRPLRHRARPA